MAPHLDQLKMFAALFAGETGLTLDDLGFATENPASQEAIKASHENLRLTARKAQRAFGSGFLNVGYLAACLRDDYQYYRNQVYMTTPIWEPVFEPDAAMLSNIGDGGFGYKAMKEEMEIALLDSIILAYWACSETKTKKRKQRVSC